MRHNITKVFKRFLRDEEGSLIIMMLILLIPMLVVAGMAVDFIRIENERIVLQGVTDRSVLSAASLTQTEDDLEMVIFDFFDSEGYGASQVTPLISENTASNRVVSASAVSQIDTFYLQFIGKPTLAAAAAATAEEGVNNVEISLVLDFSGSMRYGGSTGNVTETGTGRGRIGDLQDAAQAFAAELLKPEYDGRFSLNIVPYAGQTNPGADMFGLLGGSDNPLIYIEDAGFDLAVDKPFDVANSIYWADYAKEGFPGSYVYAGSDGVFGTVNDVSLTSLITPADPLLGGTGNKSPSSIKDIKGLDIFGPDGRYGTGDDDETASGEISKIAFAYEQQSHCMTIGSSEFAHSILPAAGSKQIDAFMYWGLAQFELEQQVMGWGWCPGDETRIQYAVQNLTVANDFFSDITLADGTGTHIGMKWGLSLLDPAARDNFTALNMISTDLVPDASVGRPADWDDAGTDKIIILMTDGFITPQYEPTGTITEQHLIAPTGGDDISEATIQEDTRSQFIEICNTAKSAERDVEIYAIAFETSDDAGALMHECASTDSHYKTAVGAGLTDVFLDIARQLTELRISK